MRDTQVVVRGEDVLIVCELQMLLMELKTLFYEKLDKEIWLDLR